MSGDAGGSALICQDEAARRFGTMPGWLVRNARLGTIPGLPVGRNRALFDPDVLGKFLRERCGVVPGTAMKPRSLVSVTELCKRHRVPRSWFTERIEAGTIPSWKYAGRHLLVDESVVGAMIAREEFVKFKPPGYEKLVGGVE